MDHRLDHLDNVACVDVMQRDYRCYDLVAPAAWFFIQAGVNNRQVWLPSDFLEGNKFEIPVRLHKGEAPKLQELIDDAERFGIGVRLGVEVCQRSLDPFQVSEDRLTGGA